LARAAAACIPSSRTSTPSTRCNSGTYQSSSLREARASTELIDARPSATRPVPASSSLKQGSPADLFKTARQEEHRGYAVCSKPRLPLRSVLEDGFCREKSAKICGSAMLCPNEGWDCRKFWGLRTTRALSGLSLTWGKAWPGSCGWLKSAPRAKGGAGTSWKSSGPTTSPTSPIRG